MSHVIFSGVVQLLGWSDTHNAGPKLVLQLENSEDLEAFKHLTVKHGKTAGQLLGIAVTIVDPATGMQPGVELEHPLATKPKGGSLSRLAGMWCGNRDFQDWIRTTFTGLWAEFDEAGADPADTTKRVLYCACEVDSLAKLDHQEAAATIFQDAIRRPFMAREASSR
ncbi:MAG: hypothetical protein ACK5PF_04550 [bacterium]|jgi:hypothetical protein